MSKSKKVNLKAIAMESVMTGKIDFNKLEDLKKATPEQLRTIESLIKDGGILQLGYDKPQYCVEGNLEEMVWYVDESSKFAYRLDVETENNIIISCTKRALDLKKEEKKKDEKKGGDKKKNKKKDKKSKKDKKRNKENGKDGVQELRSVQKGDDVVHKDTIEQK